jgi:aurora kinase
MSVPSFVSPEAKDLIKKVRFDVFYKYSSFANTFKLLVLDPAKRIPLDEIQRHPWIVKHCAKEEQTVKRSSGTSKAEKA